MAQGFWSAIIRIYIRGIKPDVVVATNPPREAIVIASRMFKGKVPIICDFQDVTDEYKQLYGKIKRFILSLLWSTL